VQKHRVEAYYYYYFIIIIILKLQRQFTLLPWCCGNKPHFLFAEAWKGVGKGMLCCYYYYYLMVPVRPITQNLPDRLL